MGFGEWHGVWTVIILVLFLAIVVWSYFSRRAKKQFDEAANSIFQDENAESSVTESDKPESKKDE